MLIINGNLCFDVRNDVPNTDSVQKTLIQEVQEKNATKEIDLIKEKESLKVSFLFIVASSCF
jgi:hypothetical protein